MTNRQGETRSPTLEEAEAILTLVRGGWLKLTLDVGVEPPRAGRPMSPPPRPEPLPNPVRRGSRRDPDLDGVALPTGSRP